MEKIQYEKSVLWLKPFIESAVGLVPVHLITRVRGYKVKLGLEEKQYAGLTKYPETREKVITLRIFEQDHKQTKHQRVRVATLLECLAHELAHLKYWDHSPEHFELQAKIQRRFVKILKFYQVEDTSVRANKKFINFITSEEEVVE